MYINTPYCTCYTGMSTLKVHGYYQAKTAPAEGTDCEDDTEVIAKPVEAVWPCFDTLMILVNGNEISAKDLYALRQNLGMTPMPISQNTIRMVIQATGRKAEYCPMCGRKVVPVGELKDVYKHK